MHAAAGLRMHLRFPGRPQVGLRRYLGGRTYQLLAETRATRLYHCNPRRQPSGTHLFLLRHSPGLP